MVWDRVTHDHPEPLPVDRVSVSWGGGGLFPCVAIFIRRRRFCWEGDQPEPLPVTRVGRSFMCGRFIWKGKGGVCQDRR